MARERWGSRLGVILAVAGSAVGLGNFLRFPGLAASQGGGAFMIPYLIALAFVGLPLMWMEWTLGRHGGSLGHGTGPGILEAISGRRGFRYLGVLGVFGPFAILVYYSLIESWTLGFTWHSLTGHVTSQADAKGLTTFFNAYRGLDPKPDLVAPWTVYLFLGLTVAANLFVISYGIRGGIEKLCKIALPLLFLLAIFMLVRTATITPWDPSRTYLDGLAFLWHPNLELLKNPTVWLRAAGQVFYTLSLGIGVILTYASYVSKKDDIAQSGLMAAATNEFAEVVLAGSIVIPIAFMFYGATQTQAIANGSIFDLAFVSMPLVFHSMTAPLDVIMCTAWFLLLFVAALTSSVSLAQPCVAFLEDELGWTRRRATAALGVAYVAILVPLALLWDRGWLGEFDFWAGTMMLVVFGLIEMIFFGWVLGIDRAWTELHEGARMRVPRFFRFICRWVSPSLLLAILGYYFYEDWWPSITMVDVPSEDRWVYWSARGALVVLFLFLAWVAWIAVRRRARRAPG